MTKYILVYGADSHNLLSECRRMVGKTSLAIMIQQQLLEQNNRVLHLGEASDNKQNRGISITKYPGGSYSRNSYLGEMLRRQYDYVILEAADRNEAVNRYKECVQASEPAESVQFIQVDATYGLDNNAPPFGPSWTQEKTTRI